MLTDGGVVGGVATVKPCGSVFGSAMATHGVRFGEALNEAKVLVGMGFGSLITLCRTAMTGLGQLTKCGPSLAH